MLLALFCVPGAFAQPAQLSGSADPSRLEKNIEQILRDPAPSPPVEIPRTLDPAKIPDGADKVLFLFNGINIEGSTVFDHAELKPFWQENVGKRISLATLYSIAESITAHYGKNGYLLSQIIVPAQKIDPAKPVLLLAVEGFVAQVTIDDSAAANKARLQELGLKIVASRPLHADTLERYLLIANDLPGIQVRAVLTPSEEEIGAADLILVASPKKKFDALLRLDNRASKYSGPVQALASLSANGLINGQDRTNLLFVMANDLGEMRYLRLGHEQTVSAEGLLLGAAVSGSRSTLGANLSRFFVSSSGESFDLYLRYPWLRSRSRNLTIKAGFLYKNFVTEQARVLLSDDRLRHLNFGVEFDWVDTWMEKPAFSRVDMRITHGLDVLGNRPSGSDLLSRDKGTTDFLRANIDFTRIIKLKSGVNLQLGLNGQYTPDELLSGEEFSFGGSRFGRGLDPSELTGDSGLAIRAEIQFLNGVLPKWTRRHSAYGFYDLGAVWDHDPSAGQAKRASGATAGFGVRAAVQKNFELNFELAKPLTHGAAARGADEAKDLRAYLSLAYRH